MLIAAVVKFATQANQTTMCHFESRWASEMNRLPCKCVRVISCVVSVAVTLGCGDTDSSSKPQAETPTFTQSDSANLVAEMEGASSAISGRVDELFRAISNGEVQHVYDTFTSPKFRGVATVEQFASICSRVNTRLGSLRSKESSRFDLNPVDGTFVASATYKATFELDSGILFVVFQKVDDEWLLLRLNVNAPKLLDDPNTFQQPTEIYVENSEPVLPGTMVDLLGTVEDPPNVIIENVRVLNVRWKVDDPSTPLKAPAKGFVTIDLKPDQMKAVESSGSVTVRIHKP